MNIRGPLSDLFGLNALVWLAMLTGLAAISCFAAAGWLALAPEVGVFLASLYTGLGLLALAVILALVVKRLANPPAKTTSTPQPPAAEARLEHGLRPLIGNRATEWTRQHTGTVIVSALAAGVLIAASPSVRRLITSAAGPALTRKAMETYKGFSDS